MGSLRRVLPRRRHAPGSRPGITGEDPLAKDTGVQDQWEFPTLRNGLTATEKRLVIAKVLKTSVLAIFKTHTYSFGGKFFHQIKVGPIGLRSTCCIARLVMLWWDDQLVVALMRNNIQMVSGARYMDNVRLFLRGVRLGWRMVKDVLVYKDAWRLEEINAGLTILEKTSEILKEIMNGICGWLVLTMETELMFGGTLPTLDLQLWVSDENKVLYKYYEKPTTPITVLHARSAIPEATRRATLNQEMIRRMTNTSELVDVKIRIVIVDEYAQKLINSEYSLEQARNFVIEGLRDMRDYCLLVETGKILDGSHCTWRPTGMQRTGKQPR